MTSWVQAAEEARDMERKNVYGVRWRELKPGQHAIVDAGASADLLGCRGVEVRAFIGADRRSSWRGSQIILARVADHIGADCKSSGAT